MTFGAFLLTTADLSNGVFDAKLAHLIFDPGKKSHPRADAVHGHSDWLLRHRDSFVDLIEPICELFAEADLIVAHNAEFDMGFINAELMRHGRAPPVKAYPLHDGDASPVGC